MRRLMFVLLVAVLLISSMACAGGTPEPKVTDSAAADKVELTFWAHQEAWNNSYIKIAEDYMSKHSNVVIKYEFFPYDEYEAKLQTSLLAKEGGADIYELWGGWAIDFASTGALMEVPEDMAKEIRADSYPSTIGSLEHDGKLYGLPMEFNIEFGGMFVNLKLLEQNGLTMPTTWDGLIEAAKKATVVQGSEFTVKGFDFVNWDSVAYLMTAMILSNGGEYLNEDGTFNFTSQQAIEAFTKLSDLVTKDKLTDLEGLTGGGALEGYQILFADGALFVPRGPWPMAEGIETFGLTYDKDFSYEPLPWINDKPVFAAETGWALAVNGSSKVKEAAFDFLDYFYSDEVLLEHNIYCSMIPPKKSVAHDAKLIEAMPFMEPLVNIIDYARYIGHFNTDVFKEAVNNTFVDYCSGAYASVEEAMQHLETELNSK